MNTAHITWEWTLDVISSYLERTPLKMHSAHIIGEYTLNKISHSKCIQYYDYRLHNR